MLMSRIDTPSSKISNLIYRNASEKEEKSDKNPMISIDQHSSSIFEQI